MIRSLRGTCSTFAVALLVASRAAHADDTAVSIADTSQSVGAVPKVMSFPLTRSGDLAFPLAITAHTVNGTAIAGTDYTALPEGTLVRLPAAVGTGTIDVDLPVSPFGPDTSFDLVLDGIVGLGPTLAFGAPVVPASNDFPPNAAVLGDFNLDGRRDVVMVAAFGNVATVYVNTTAPGASSASFGATTVTTDTSASPVAVAVADFNGDGRLDYVTANVAGSDATVAMNTTPAGTVQPTFVGQTVVTGGDPYAVATPDVNGDGRPDVVIGNNSPSSVAVFLNQTAPGAVSATFGSALATFAVGSLVQAIAVGDLNGDGRPDVVTVNGGNNNVSVLLNNTAAGASTPSFDPHRTFATGTFPLSVVVGDLNGDGRPDLAVANYSSDTASVLFNVPPGVGGGVSFAPGRSVDVGQFPYAIALADLNGDGLPDLVTSKADDSVSLLANATAPGASLPNFLPRVTVGSGSQPYIVALGDLNGDGRPDLVTANNGGNNMSAQINTVAAPSAVFDLAPLLPFAVGTSGRDTTAADVNQDGLTDLIICLPGALKLLLNITAPGAGTPAFADAQDAAASDTYDMVATDLNGDGRPDLAAPHYNGNAVYVLLNTTPPGAASTSFAATQSFGVGSFPYAIAAADLDGDGRHDLIAVNRGDASVSVLRNTTPIGGAAATYATATAFAVGASPTSAAVSDVNGDGRLDLAVANRDGGTVSVLLNNGAVGAAPSFAAQSTINGFDTPEEVRFTDINGDGRADVIAALDGLPGVMVALNTTALGATPATFASAMFFGMGGSPRTLTTADMDGDGRADLVTADHSSDTLSVRLNTTVPGATTPAFGEAQPFATDAGGAPDDARPLGVVAADLNGDGRPDLATTNSVNGNVAVLLNAQYRVSVAGSPATGTIVDLAELFKDGFESP